MAMVLGPFVGLVVDSGLHLGRPRLLVVRMGVRLPAGVQLVASLGTGALAVAAGAGECPSRGRRSVRAAAAGNGVSSSVLPDYASSVAGLFFGSAASSISSVAPAAGSRAAAGPGRASHGGVVVAAAAGSPADDGVDDDPTPAEIDKEEEEKRIKHKEQWMKDGEKYVLGWNAEEAQAQRGNRYQEWLLLPREDGESEKEMTATITTMFTKEHVLKLIEDFNRQDVATDTFLVCKEKGLIEFFGRALICGASLLEESMIARPPSSENYEALATIGKEPKVAATECQRGYLQSESLDRALVAIKRLRATSLGLPEDSLDRLDISVRLPQRPRREFAVDDTEQAMTYFILMAAYTHDVMAALLKDLYERPATRGYY